MDHNNTQTTISSSETITTNLVKETYHGGKIIAYTVSDIRRETIDAWATNVVKDLENWSAERPFLSLQDFSSDPNFSFTPYIREKSEEIIKPRPEVAGRTAVVLKKSFGARLVQVFLLAKKNVNRQRKLFFSRTEALKWLEEWLDPANVPSKRS